MTTPLYKANRLANKLGLTAGLYLKREDLHPLGSHKGRAMPLMIETYAEDGWKNFVISSSGNAALAAGLYIKTRNKKNPKSPLKINIFVGEKIDQNKLARLKKLTDKNIIITQTKNPKQVALQAEKSGQAKNLRQSTDDTALAGYYELAKELAEIKNLTALFVPTSSGTTAQGLYEGFKRLKINPQVHIIQTTACHPIADKILSKKSTAEKTGHESLASAIVDKIAYRKNKVVEAIKNSHGSAHIASNEEIMAAMNILKKIEGLDISANSALSLVGLLKSIQTGATFTGSVVCILTGK